MRSLKKGFLRRLLALCLFCRVILVSVVSLIIITSSFLHRSFDQDLTPCYAAVMFHTSVNAFFPPLENLASFLDREWHVYLFLPGGAYSDFLSDKLKLEAAVGHMLRQRFIKLSVRMHEMGAFESDVNRALENVHGAGVRIANSFALSREVYESIAEERILFFQSDSAFCSSALRDYPLKYFMHYLWLGAPWNHQVQNLSIHPDSNQRVGFLDFGNGGVSVRSRAFVLDCLDKAENSTELSKARSGFGVPEDVFFSRCLFEHHPNEANITAAHLFAAEEIISHHVSSIAVHDPCRVANYNVPNVIGCASETHMVLTRKLMQRCPEARRIVRKCVEACDFGNLAGDLFF